MVWLSYGTKKGSTSINKATIVRYNSYKLTLPLILK